MNSMLRTALLGTVAAASLAAPHFAFAQTAGQAVDVEKWWSPDRASAATPSTPRCRCR
uniref:Uncharacterized protein n=1 Tax=Phenylobacterium glaciei TaxID=2803784 RepID=A0A974P4T5_9CAUL|nr:hypothetical protein JKL49_08940 [Phenylobacterium glaciei]